MGHLFTLYVDDHDRANHGHKPYTAKIDWSDSSIPDDGDTVGLGATPQEAIAAVLDSYPETIASMTWSHRSGNARCEAVISALENLRDAPVLGVPPTMADIFAAADGYITDDLSTCTCKQP